MSAKLLYISLLCSFIVIGVSAQHLHKFVIKTTKMTTTIQTTHKRSISKSSNITRTATNNSKNISNKYIFSSTREKLGDNEVSKYHHANAAYCSSVYKDTNDEYSQLVFTVVEQIPEFPDGQSTLLQFIAESIKYQVLAIENGVQERVICTFTVNRDGSFVDSHVLRGVDPFLDKEALRVIYSMPKWFLGKDRGKSVRVKYTLPITFRLKSV